MENKLIYIIAREIYIALATTILGKVVSLSLPINKKLQVMDNKQACSNHCFKGHSAWLFVGPTAATSPHGCIANAISKIQDMKTREYVSVHHVLRSEGLINLQSYKFQEHFQLRFIYGAGIDFSNLCCYAAFLLPVAVSFWSFLQCGEFFSVFTHSVQRSFLYTFFLLLTLLSSP